MITDEIVKGCFLGGAIGDAYVEEEISATTQLTLFTAEALIWAKKKINQFGDCNIASKCFYCYQRWLYTQDVPLAEKAYTWVLDDSRLEFHSPLLQEKQLHKKRNPDSTTVDMLSRIVEQNYGTVQSPINTSKNYGGLVRVAPIGLYYYASPRIAFDMGVEVAAITHSHATAYLSAGVFSAIIAYLVQGKPMRKATELSMNLVRRFSGSDGIVEKLKQALYLEEQGEPSREKMASIGEGWDADEALAIAVYAACCFEDSFSEAIKLAVSHQGNRDSVAAICGNLLGARGGKSSIPSEWLERLQLREVIEEISVQIL